MDFPDQDLAHRLNCHLKAVMEQRKEPIPEFSISVHDGCVAIRGVISTERQRDLVRHACCRVAGVLQLDDRDLVAEPVDSCSVPLPPRLADSESDSGSLSN